MKRLLVTQPYLPRYRVPLFEAISGKLLEVGVEMTVAAGVPFGTQARRNDEAGAPWLVTAKSWTVSAFGQRVEWRQMPRGAGRPDIVVSELAALNTFAWSTSMAKVPLILWGHGKAYVNSPSWIGDHLEWALAKRAAQVMTYTGGGRTYLIDKGGLDPSKVTAIGNSTDSMRVRSGFVKARAERSTPAAAADGPCAIYVGGLDASKRIDFLIQAAFAAKLIDPRFLLIVVGSGELEREVQAAIEQGGPIEWIADSRSEDLGSLGARAHALWMPGRVGLAAIDAVAMGIPVHTTNFPFHAPEVELLVDGEIEYLSDMPTSFAAESLLRIEIAPSAATRPLRPDIPTIDSVATSFADVVASVVWDGRLR